MTIADRLIRRASEIFDVCERDLRLPYRDRPLADTRHAICKVASEAGLTMQAIGTALNRDRCTARDSRNRASELEKANPTFAARINALRTEVMGEKA